MHRVSKVAILFLLAANLVACWLWSREALQSPPSVAPPAVVAAATQGGGPDDLLTAPGGAAHLGVEPPFGGPAPTKDPSTWTLVPAAMVVGALVEIDSRPATVLTAQQGQRCLEFVAEITSAAASVNANESAFAHAMTSVLTPSQVSAMDEQRAQVERAPLDLLRLVEDTRALAARGHRAGPASFHARPGAAPPQTAFLLGGLAFLEKPGPLVLSPDQAAALVDNLEALVRSLNAQASCYPLLNGVLTEIQFQELVRVLQDVHSGRLDASTVYLRLPEAESYLRNRPGP